MKVAIIPNCYIAVDGEVFVFFIMNIIQWVIKARFEEDQLEIFVVVSIFLNSYLFYIMNIMKNCIFFIRMIIDCSL